MVWHNVQRIMSMYVKETTLDMQPFQWHCHFSNTNYN